MRPEPDLNWLAFLYVSGELTAAEADEFERRLDHDQSAREAVAEAVGLASAVATLPANTLDTLPLRRRPWLRVAAALAASLLLTVGLVRFAPRQRPDVPKANPRAVALLWSGLHEQNAAEADDLMSWLDESERHDETEVVAASDAVPSWLWEAATLPKAEGPDAQDIQEN